MLKPMVGGTLVTVILLTPGKNRSLVSVISGVPTLGRAPAEEEDLVAVSYTHLTLPTNREV